MDIDKMGFLICGQDCVSGMETMGVSWPIDAGDDLQPQRMAKIPNDLRASVAGDPLKPG